MHDWANASLEARDAHIANLYFDFPAASRARQELDLHRRAGAVGREATCLVLHGPSRSGKSTVIDKYLRDMKIEGTKVLKVEVPSKATQTTLAQAILEELGDGAFAHKKISGPRFTRRVTELMPRSGVEMLILDEFQHLIDSDSRKVRQSAADWVKTLLNEGRTPIVLAGMNETARIVGGHPQLRLRSDGTVRMSVFDWRDREDRRTFRMILDLFDRHLPFPCAAGLSQKELAARIHYASEGLIGGVSRLLRKAARQATARRVATIDMACLIEAADQLHLDNPDDDRRWTNPFKVATAQLDQDRPAA